MKRLPTQFAASQLPDDLSPLPLPQDDVQRGRRSVAELYETHFAFVFRTMRRLGVPSAQLDDAVQDTFLVLHRRFDELQWSSSEKTLLFGIALRVAKDQRRTVSRRREHSAETTDPASTALEVQEASPGPAEVFAQEQARTILYSLLDQLEDELRAIFISVELEQMPVTEVARAMKLNVNTTYTRLRTARREFEQALARFQNSGGKGRL